MSVVPERPATLEDVRDEVAGLTDLFRRRLMDDKARNSLTEALKEQARAAQDLLRHRAFEDLFRESLLPIDRLRSESPTPELVESAIEELLEVFARRTLIPVDDSGGFDPRVHEVVESIPATSRTPAGSIVAVHRTGYTLDGRLLRPTQVTVAVAEPALEPDQDLDADPS
jgi:molecular chaperone GrpE